MVEAIEHEIFITDENQKEELISKLLSDKNIKKVLVFSRTKYKCDKINRHLKKEGFKSNSIHSNKSQSKREIAMKSFRNGKSKILVATDIASRGIDITDITHVINYDMPLNPEIFVHRIGRTARAGAKGLAISFCNSNEQKLLRIIARRTGINFPEPSVISTKTTRGENNIDKPTKKKKRISDNKKGNRKDKKSSNKQDTNNTKKKINKSENPTKIKKKTTRKKTNRNEKNNK